MFWFLDLEEANLNKPDDECDKSQEWATGKSELLKSLSSVRGSILLRSAIFHVVGQLPRSGEDLNQEKTKKERKKWVQEDNVKMLGHCLLVPTEKFVFLKKAIYHRPKAASGRECLPWHCIFDTDSV